MSIFNTVDHGRRFYGEASTGDGAHAPYGYETATVVINVGDGWEMPPGNWNRRGKGSFGIRKQSTIITASA